jgi:hypothetical protein
MKAQFKLLRMPEKELTPGLLFFHDKHLCDTLEDIVRDRNADGDLNDEDEGKVYGETAIPYDTYELKATWSPKFKKIMTLICNVNHFDGIRIHWGATIKQSYGCLLVGEADGDRLIDIGMTDKITLMVQELEARGEKVYLEIQKP